MNRGRDAKYLPRGIDLNELNWSPTPNAPAVASLNFQTEACDQAAALTLLSVGTDAIVLRIWEAIWYGSPCEFGRRSSR